MGCNCGNSAPTGFGSNPQQEQQSLQQKIQEQQSQATNDAQRQALASGQPMSFALRDQQGRTQTFGSALERNAYMTRNGGSIA